MPAAPNLEELTVHIRKVLPEPKALAHLQTNAQAGVVEFNWHARHFVVRPTMEVYELKGRTLLITGISMLIQAALQTKDRNTKIIEVIVETLQAAEESMRTNRERGYSLLAEVKKTLSRLAGKHA